MSGWSEFAILRKKEEIIEPYQQDFEAAEASGDVLGMAEALGNRGLQYINSGKAEAAMLLFIQVQLVFMRQGEAEGFKQVNRILNSIVEQVGEPIYAHLAEPPMQHVLANGIQWGRHQIMTPEEAEDIFKKLEFLQK